MIFYGIAGINYSEGEITVDPYLPEGINEATITGLPVGDRTVSIQITRDESGACKAQVKG